MGRLLVLFAVLCVSLWAQQTGIIQGVVTDETGAVIPGASITITGPAEFSRTVTTDETGNYSIPGVPPGSYTLSVASTGFAPFRQTVDVAGAKTVTLDAALSVTLEKQEINVAGDTQNQVTTDPTSNAGAIVLRNEDLDALSDDPDELAEDLQALAGPAAGPNGGEIFVDGFSGARLPPKASIREVRINQNPFSAEYDRLGFGRIEILTKPGSDKLRGQGFFNFSDESLNSRNPFATNRPPFQLRMYGFNVGGPLTKRSSWFIDVDRRDIDDNEVVNATILNPDFSFGTFQQAILAPHRRTTVNPRVDYQLSTNHTLVLRYGYEWITQENAGIGSFTLPERGFRRQESEHTVQLTETAVLGATAINETRLQFEREDSERLGDNSIPAINVLQSFSAGGPQVGNAGNLETSWELHNTTSIVKNTHTIRFGGRVRTWNVTDVSPANFGGTWTFAGGLAPALDGDLNPVAGDPLRITSLERYRRTLLFQQRGYTPEQIRALGGGATQFTIAGGNPLADVRQTDVGLFVQDDWRLRPNVTVSLGLRYEAQTNIENTIGLAPRIGVAWAPGGGQGQPGKTVVRGGFGIFYDRVNRSLTLDTIRFNGLLQEQYTVSNPDFFPVIPTLEELGDAALPQTIQRFSPDLRAPYIMQGAIGVERQLPGNTTAAVTFTNSRGLHQLRSRAIGFASPGSEDIIYQYESSGRLNQQQLMFNVNSRFSRRVTLFSFYVLNRARSDTDGPGTFAADPWNYAPEYGRASNDARNFFMIGGALTAPWGLRMSPFVVGRTGGPFNITTGTDLNGDTVFVDRPSFATTGEEGARVTPWGIFDPTPEPGDTIIPRNWGQAPNTFTVNLRVSKTFGFGESQNAAAGGPGAMGGGRGGGGRRGPGGGGMRMGGGMGGLFADGGTNSRYNLTISVSARNLLNTTNLGPPVGNLSSPLFGESIGIAGGWGPGGGANNRRVELQARFSF